MRPADAGDTEPVAAILTASRAAARDVFGPPLHSAEEDRAFVAGRVRDSEVWVAAHRGERLSATSTSTATGSTRSTSTRAPSAGASGPRWSTWPRPSGPDGFGLWVFVSNTAARAFYRRPRPGRAGDHRRLGQRGEARPTCVSSGPEATRWPSSAARSTRSTTTSPSWSTAGSRSPPPCRPTRTPRATPGATTSGSARSPQRLAARTPDLDERTWEPIVAALVETGLDVAERRTP